MENLPSWVLKARSSKHVGEKVGFLQLVFSNMFRASAWALGIASSCLRSLSFEGGCGLAGGSSCARVAKTAAAEGRELWPLLLFAQGDVSSCLCLVSVSGRKEALAALHDLSKPGIFGHPPSMRGQRCGA